MIVEDEVVIAQDLERRLEGMGLDVVAIAHSAEDALRAACETRPILVLMDIGLGGDDGLTTAEKLQREVDCAVVFVTGYADSETLARIGGLTSAVYVSKPFSDPVLRASVRLALFRHYADKERRRVEQERSLAEARLRAVLDHTVDGVVSLDHEQRIVVFSRGAQLQFGYADAEVLGHPLDLLLAPSEQDRSARVERLLVGDGLTNTRLVREMGQRKDGSAFPIEISVSHLPNSNDRPSILCVRDTTERDRLEGRLKLVEQLQIVGSLSASMTHEFNNVLTAVESNAFCLGTYLPLQGRQYLDALAGAVDRGRALSRQLLRLNSAGSAQDVSVSIDVNESIHNLQRLLHRTLRKNVQVDLQLGADAGAVLAHEYAIEHVVLNLVHNARDAMPVGGKVTIATGSLDVRGVEQFQALEPGLYGTVSVTDQGEGISSTIAPRLFEPFMTTKPPGAGLGLGLHISRAIARRSGGDLWVGELKPCGSVFTLALKRASSGASQSSTESTS
jgi:PAS domain S-box-containing protein